MRSSKCSRTDPSSGLYVAIRSGLQGCLKLMPSRSTIFTPSVNTFRSKLLILSSNRLISSTYNTPLCASARRPGWKTVVPVFTDSSTSTEPISLSSVTPSGIYIIETYISDEGHNVTVIWHMLIQVPEQMEIERFLSVYFPRNHIEPSQLIHLPIFRKYKNYKLGCRDFI